MHVRHLRVQNIRIHQKCDISFTDTVTLIVGKNGSGKTSLIEAIYLALRGKSFKGNDDSVCRSGEDWSRIDLETDVDTRIVKYQRSVAKKTFEIDHTIHRRLVDRVKYPIVLFEPDDLRIITGSPARRREYLDNVIAQYDPHYGQTLRRYERALMQRNKLLKQPHLHPDEVFAWNVALSQYGAVIIAARQALIEYVDARIMEVYRTIAPTDDMISLHYSHQTNPSSQHLLTELEQAYERDRAVGSTTVGPHRHDLHIVFNTAPAADGGSRGELRTITLALKFIEASRIIETTGSHPLILLDDVFSELDHIRQQRLLSEFQDHQVIITSASTDAYESAPSVYSL